MADDKHMSLDDLIKKDKESGKGFNLFPKKFDKKQRSQKINKKFVINDKKLLGQKNVRRFQKTEMSEEIQLNKRGNQNFEIRKTNNMISKENMGNKFMRGSFKRHFIEKRPFKVNVPNHERQFNNLSRQEEEDYQNYQQPQRQELNEQNYSSRPMNTLSRRDQHNPEGKRGHELGPDNDSYEKERKVEEVKPKEQPTTIERSMVQSDVRLKVRNLQEDQLSNEDLHKLFSAIGELDKCFFDRNEKGKFLGSATVQFKRPQDAKKAIEQYDEAYLDNNVIKVEYDIMKLLKRVPVTDKRLDRTNRK